MKKSILITGCSTGIGYCAAKTLQQRGYQVFASCRKLEDIERLRGEGLNAIPLDMDNSASIKTAVKSILQQTGGTLDALFNNAGYGQAGALEDISRDAIRNQFETNLFGLLELTNMIIPIMRKQGHGRIINVSSLLGFVTFAYRGAYNASKFALEGLTDTLRLELTGTGIDVGLIEPGPIHSYFRKSAYARSLGSIDIDNSPHKKFYEQMIARNQTEQKDPSFTLQPEAVVKKLIHALESKKPKARYFVTTPTYIFAALKRLLPTRWLDRVMLKIMRSEAE